MSRIENVIRHKRFKMLSDVLKLRHQHDEYIKLAGQHDSVGGLMDSLQSAMKSARGQQRAVYVQDFRRRESRLANERLQRIVTEAAGVQSVSLTLRFGPVSFKKEKIPLTRNWYYMVQVGWMWNKRVFDELYNRCNYAYGYQVILSAERVRVNHKWCDLFEVRAYHLGLKQMRTGYVARTRTDRRNTVFNQKASLAIKAAEAAMQKEMNHILTGATT